MAYYVRTALYLPAGSSSSTATPTEAAASVSALDATVLITPFATEAAVGAAANDAVPLVTVLPAEAAVSVVAQQPSVTSAAIVAATEAAGAVAAFDAKVIVTAIPAEAAVTLDAPFVTSGGLVGLTLIADAPIDALIEAFDPGHMVTALPSEAAVGVAAYDATVLTTGATVAPAGVADIGVTAPFDTAGGTNSLTLIADAPIDALVETFDPGKTVAPNADVAVVGVGAFDATVVTTTPGTAAAGTAGATVAAFDATVSITANADYALVSIVSHDTTPFEMVVRIIRSLLPATFQQFRLTTMPGGRGRFMRGLATPVTQRVLYLSPPSAQYPQGRVEAATSTDIRLGWDADAVIYDPENYSVSSFSWQAQVLEANGYTLEAVP